MNLINFLKSLYQKRQLAEIRKDFFSNAQIGPFFECDLSSCIRNESGRKERIIIGHHCRVNGSLMCKENGLIQLGNFTTLQNNAHILCLTSVKIGHFVGIADGTIITDNNNHSIDPIERVKHRIRVAPGGEGYPGMGNGWELSESAPTVIEDVVWIGANATILKGVVVGEGAVVAKNAVVTKSVPPYTLVAGNPAKIVREIQRPANKYYEVDL
jgi:acetyltransferase-like isoleucine patch superfamily enzyme